MGSAGGGGFPSKTVVAAECAASVDCTAVSAGRFTNFVTAVRSTGIFTTDFSFFHLGVGFAAAHYQDGVSPSAVRYQQCLGSFSQCNDPAATSWSTAAAASDGLDYDGQNEGQHRGASDVVGDPFGMFVDEDLDFVYLVYLRP